MTDKRQTEVLRELAGLFADGNRLQKRTDGFYYAVKPGGVTGPRCLSSEIELLLQSGMVTTSGLTITGQNFLATHI